MLGSGMTAIGFILFLVRDFSQIALISIILPNAMIVAGTILSLYRDHAFFRETGEPGTFSPGLCRFYRIVFLFHIRERRNQCPDGNCFGCRCVLPVFDQPGSMFAKRPGHSLTLRWLSR